MALHGITSPQKLIIPLFFNKKQRGELARLFRPDSVLKHLMDEWKQDAVASQHREQLNLIRYLRSKISLLKSPKLLLIKHLDSSFKTRIQKLLSSKDPFTVYLQSQFSKITNQVDNQILITLMKYYAILEQHKRLAMERCTHISVAFELKKIIQKFSKRLSQFGAVVQFETWGAVQLHKLQESNPQFSRCQKALYDNIKTGAFSGTDFSSLKLHTAFKIQNTINLKNFQKISKEASDSIMKGLFVSVKKKNLVPMILYGAKSKQFIQEEGNKYFRKEYYRLPFGLTERSNVEQFIKASEGLTGALYGSSSSTLQRDKKKLKLNENCCFYLVLARVILKKNKVEAGYDQNLQEYLLEDFQRVYPEYILICTKEKFKFEVVPEKHMIIPARICELDYLNPARSNVMPAHVFYSTVNRALENSHQQRQFLRGDLNDQIQHRISPQTRSVDVRELKKPVLKEFYKGVDKLEKELKQAKEMTASLVKNL